MLFFAVTKPKKKMVLIAKLAFLVLLLGVIVPGVYYGLSNAGAMESFMQGLKNDESTENNVIIGDNNQEQQASANEIKEEAMPGEPIRVVKNEETPSEVKTENATDNKQAADTNKEGQEVKDDKSEINQEDSSKQDVKENKESFWQKILNIAFGSHKEIEATPQNEG